MFRFRKHDKDICLSFHIGYDPEYKTGLLDMSFYKYSMSIQLGAW